MTTMRGIGTEVMFSRWCLENGGLYGSAKEELSGGLDERYEDKSCVSEL